MPNGGPVILAFEYNADGMRTRKTSSDSVSEYYHGTQLVHLKRTEGNTTSNLHFYYNAEGKPAMVKYNGAYYVYVTNLQGDIIGIADNTKTWVVRYRYDAWGRHTHMYGTMRNTLGKLNPFRYRGYVFDEETGLYYASSRYFDPEICRFINSDDTSYLGANGDIVSYNLFAYCGNNPVTGYDPDGTLDWGNLLKGCSWLAVGVTAIAVGVSVLTCGVAAPAMMAVAAVTVTAGAATVVNGVSELGEATTGHNFMRDDVFRGNTEAYNSYAHTTAAVAIIGTMVCGGWLKGNAPRIKAYNNIENYQYTKTISDAQHMKRPYASSVLTQKGVIKYGKMTKDPFGYGYVFSSMGSVNGNDKLWRLGVNIREELIWHWGHGF